MKPKKKAGALSRSRPAAARKVSRARPKVAELVDASKEWTPLMEERRQGGGPQDGMDGRREVDRAKEEKEGEDDSGGPDA